MKIGIIGSMHHTEKMLEARDELMRRGHEAFVTIRSPKSRITNRKSLQ